MAKFPIPLLQLIIKQALSALFPVFHNREVFIFRMGAVAQFRRIPCTIKADPLFMGPQTNDEYKKRVEDHKRALRLVIM